MNILSYLDHVERRLRYVPRPRRVAFAARCAEVLFREFRTSLHERIGAESTAFLANILESLWSFAILESPLPEPRVRSAMDFVARLSWPDPDMTTLADHGSAETLSALLHATESVLGGGHEASQAAERVINRIDFELQQSVGPVEPWHFPSMVHELSEQERCLRFLEGNAPITHEFRGQGTPAA